MVEPSYRTIIYYRQVHVSSTAKRGKEREIDHAQTHTHSHQLKGADA